MRALWRFPLAPAIEVAGWFSCKRAKSEGRPSAPLGARILTNPEHIFRHNMWDHVQWSEQEKEFARQKVTENSREKIPVAEQAKFDIDASKYWDGFYEMHQNKFFKDRSWLFHEFPELLTTETPGCILVPEPGEGQRNGAPTLQQGSGGDGETADFPGKQASFRIFEIGCGAGNSVFPIISSIRGTGSFLYCCDFSPRAVRLVKDHPGYDGSVCHAFVHDIRQGGAVLPFPPRSLDVVLLVFMLSSVHPARVQDVVSRLAHFLKPGGVLLFRDYGRYDLSQLRFKKGRCLSENFYTRGDGTCVYFFTKDEIHELFKSAGLEEIQNLEDRRLQVNRGKKVVMRRVWMQGKFRKPCPSP
ncbi:tRNA N(3)-methylcytidine methyltransferase METTL8, mitochondrial [Paramormyrops kingsleyae]|uniref:tRNA N(3)-methylcytidine methyltransferase METTL8, mitochondrial n=1 Tax=Paramormyrops kingsleyae TaxID=1676925 RepID=UPI003B96D416